MITGGRIKKIIFGTDPTKGLAFFVGQTFGNIQITEILRDEDNFFYFNVIRYLIYVTENNEKYLWKAAENVPVFVEYYVEKPVLQ